MARVALISERVELFKRLRSNDPDVRAMAANSSHTPTRTLLRLLRSDESVDVRRVAEGTLQRRSTDLKERADDAPSTEIRALLSLRASAIDEGIAKAKRVKQGPMVPTQ